MLKGRSSRILRYQENIEDHWRFTLVKEEGCLKSRVLIFLISSGIFFVSSTFVYGNLSSVPPPHVSKSWVSNSVHLTSSREGWAAGIDYENHRGVLLHYSGAVWNSELPPLVSSDWILNSVHFTSSGEGWAVGGDNANRKGILLHYSGGKWSSVAPPSVSSDWRLSSVHFTSPNEGWAVGADDANGSGVLLHYSGGVWNSELPPLVSSEWILIAFISLHPGKDGLWEATMQIVKEFCFIIPAASGVQLPPSCEF